jgi:hypothetical protein
MTLRLGQLSGCGIGRDGHLWVSHLAGVRKIIYVKEHWKLMSGLSNLESGFQLMQYNEMLQAPAEL